MKRKNKKAVEEIIEQPIVDEVIEQSEIEEPIIEEIHEEENICEECLLNVDQLPKAQLEKHTMILKSTIGYIPEVGNIIIYKGHNCKVVRVIKDMIFLLVID